MGGNQDFGEYDEIFEGVCGSVPKTWNNGKNLWGYVKIMGSLWEVTKARKVRDKDG